jgi:peptidoglycan DL-endopeptidase CwlO
MFRRLVTVLTTVLISLVGVVVYPASAALAADPEGGTAAMRRQLDEAQRGYLDAKATVDASKTRLVQLTADLTAIQDRLGVETAAVGEMAAAAYQASGFTAVAGVLSTGSSGGFLDGITLLNAVATHETNMVRNLLTTRNEANAAKAAIDAEIGAQQEALAAMQARKQQAEQALWAVGGGQATGGFSAASSVIAVAAPRNANGGWSPESRSVYEPTSGGYITPRTAHAKAQAQAAGFDRYVSCYRPLEDGGEHPRGRACDFMVSGGNAMGADRSYGNNLAAFFLFNAERLGVLYIIWYRQIWLPSSGWRTYYGCCDSSSMHTNHVHLSVY